MSKVLGLIQKIIPHLPHENKDFGIRRKLIFFYYYSEILGRKDVTFRCYEQKN